MSEKSDGSRHSLSIKIGELIEAHATGAGIVAVVVVVIVVIGVKLWL